MSEPRVPTPRPAERRGLSLAMTIHFRAQDGSLRGDPDIAIDAGIVRRVAAGETQLEELVAWLTYRTTRP